MEAPWVLPLSGSTDSEDLADALLEDMEKGVPCLQSSRNKHIVNTRLRFGLSNLGSKNASGGMGVHMDLHNFRSSWIEVDIAALGTAF